MSVKYQHTPVMLKEVLEYLNPRLGQNFIDCTLGGAGYTIEVAKRVGNEGKVIAIDLDKMAIENAKLQIINYKLQNIILVHDNFKNLPKIVKKYWPDEQDVYFSGIVFDLGLSSAQLQDRNRGFSFQTDASLDMAFGPSDITTEQLVNNCRQDKLEKIIREYGEERFAKRIAGAIVKARKIAPVKTTGQLVEIIRGAVPAIYRNNKRINPATRTFQALRIATNNELENLKLALKESLDLLSRGGRIVVVSYHSLEDRIVKHFFGKEAKECICPPGIAGEAGPQDYLACRCQHQARLKILTKKIIRPNSEEIISNPRSRSAKLRVAEII